jgi:hypothetical protein
MGFLKGLAVRSAHSASNMPNSKLQFKSFVGNPEEDIGMWCVGLPICQHPCWRRIQCCEMVLIIEYCDPHFSG